MQAKQTPMMQQYLDIKKDYKDYILFYRLGDFYEMFFEDAKIASKELDLTLTKRNKNSEVPLCGVPFHSSYGYIVKLVEKGYKVAICEQVEDPKEAKGIVKREIVKIITPGTIGEFSVSEENLNNFLASVYIQNNVYIIAYTDVTTLSVYVEEFSSFKELLDEINKLEITEIILEAKNLIGNFNYNDLNIINNLENIQKIVNDKETLDLANYCFKNNILITWRSKIHFDYKNSIITIKRVFNVYDINVLDIDIKSEIISAIGILVGYVEENKKSTLSNFQNIKQIRKDDFMIIDNFTRINLELTSSNNRKNTTGTLLWVLDKTKTTMGKRLLKRFIEKPLINKEKIRKRSDFVDIFYKNNNFNDELKEILKNIYDIEKILSKIVFLSANPKDIVFLKNSIQYLPKIKMILEKIEIFEVSERQILNEFLEDFDELSDLYQILNEALIEEAPLTFRDSNIFKDDYNEEIKEYRYILKNGNDFLKEFELKEKEKTKIKTLKVAFNKVFGYYIEISKGQTKLVPENYIRKQTLANAERYINYELKEFETKMLGADEKLKNLEYNLFIEFRQNLLNFDRRIKKAANKIAYIDVILSFAEVAIENNYVRANFCNDNQFQIEDARHPVVEMIENKEHFISNSTFFNDDNLIQIITGPNMAGKSTYLRQVALISIMAQIGSFVPCKSASLCIVDRVFTRVGASDDLFTQKSTFMVEMNELATILNCASSKSLIILDEIGRGTATFDGLSIAWAVVEYINKKIKAKTLFATHYHELSELEGYIEGVKNYRITVLNTKDDLIFLRKIEKGSANQSLGIEVAKLAGIPKFVVDRASEILKVLEDNDINKKIIFSDLKKDNEKNLYIKNKENEIIEFCDSSLLIDNNYQNRNKVKENIQNFKNIEEISLNIENNKFQKKQNSIDIDNNESQSFNLQQTQLLKDFSNQNNLLKQFSIEDIIFKNKYLKLDEFLQKNNFNVNQVIEILEKYSNILRIINDDKIIK